METMQFSTRYKGYVNKSTGGLSQRIDMKRVNINYTKQKNQLESFAQIDRFNITTIRVTMWKKTHLK